MNVSATYLPGFKDPAVVDCIVDQACSGSGYCMTFEGGTAR